MPRPVRSRSSGTALGVPSSGVVAGASRLGASSVPLVRSASSGTLGAMTAHDPAAVLVEARRELARLPVVVPALLTGLDPALWRARPAPDEWSAVEIVCHLRDEEVEDFGARVRVILDGGHAFERIDPPRWAIERRYREAEPEGALSALLERRAASLEFLGRVDPARLERAIEPPRLGRMSGVDLVAAWVTHDR